MKSDEEKKKLEIIEKFSVKADLSTCKSVDIYDIFGNKYSKNIKRLKEVKK